MMMGASHAGEESDQDSNTEMVADVDLPDDSGASGADGPRKTTAECAITSAAPTS